MVAWEYGQRQLSLGALPCSPLPAHLRVAACWALVPAALAWLAVWWLHHALRVRAVLAAYYASCRGARARCPAPARAAAARAAGAGCDRAGCVGAASAASAAAVERSLVAAHRSRVFVDAAAFSAAVEGVGAQVACTARLAASVLTPVRAPSCAARARSWPIGRSRTCTAAPTAWSTG